MADKSPPSAPEAGELAQQLRELSGRDHIVFHTAKLLREAAAEIERLRALSAWPEGSDITDVVSAELAVALSYSTDERAALSLKLAETEKQLAEADAVIINSDWKVSVQLLRGARRVELAKWRKDAMVRIGLRSAATSGKGE